MKPARCFVALIGALAASPAFAACGTGDAGDAETTTRGNGTRSAQGASTGRRSEADKVRDVVDAWIRASLDGDATRMCALVHPAKLRYLEQIDHPCEDLMSGTLTAESARNERSTTITSVDIDGATAIAHTRSLTGTRDIHLYRVAGKWLIRQF